MALAHTFPVGRAPFRLFPARQVDAAGEIDFGNLFDALASISGLVARVVGSDELDSFTGTERNGLGLLALSVSEAFESLGDLTSEAIDRAVAGSAEAVERLEQQCAEMEKRIKSKDALIAALRQELAEDDLVPRRRGDAPAPAPDLTEPADPPRAAVG